MRATAICASSLAFLTLGLTGQGTIDLPRTGQTKCYNQAGLEIACAGTGQDGDIQAGITPPSPRFTDNRDGTVTDNLTGLVWLKNANCANTVGYDPDGTGTGQVLWVNALTFVAGINDGTHTGCQAGHTDWRLPNVNELASLGTYSSLAPALTSGHPFTNLGGGWGYWSSTSDWSDRAWEVSFYNGQPSTLGKGSWHQYIWPVRGTSSGSYRPPKTGQTNCYDVSGSEIGCAGTGQDGETALGVAWPSPRFRDNGDGTISDYLTGLIWLKDMNCVDTIGYDPDSTGDGSVTWQHALDFVNGVNSGTFATCGAGKSDWRLPNSIEIISLISPSEIAPTSMLVGTGFTNVTSARTWSSMTVAGNPAQESLASAYAMAIVNGSWAHVPKTDRHAVWLVRSGPRLEYFVAEDH